MISTTIAPQVQVADINSDPYFRHLLGTTFKSEAARKDLAACVNTWHANQLERYCRSPPAVGLSNERLLDLAVLASLRGDPEKIIDYARSVLSAATHASPLLAAAQRALTQDTAQERTT
jgi:hypothetical protein